VISRPFLGDFLRFLAPFSERMLAIPVLADMQTMEEKFGSLKGLRMAYLGDIRNNMTYDLMRGGSLMGFTVLIFCISFSNPP